MRGLRQRVLLMVGRGIIKAIDDSGGIQKLQCSFLKNEASTGMERMGNYGISSWPLPDCEVLAVFIGGNRDHGIIVATEDRRHRVKNGNEGDIAIYTYENTGHATGHRIVLKDGRKIDIKCDTYDKKTDTDEIKDIGNDVNKTIGNDETKIVGGSVSTNITGSEAKIITLNKTTSVDGFLTVIATGAILFRGLTIAVSNTAGDEVKISGSEIKVKSAVKVKLEAPSIEILGAAQMTGNVAITGTLAVNGNITATGTITDSAGNTNNHSHP